MASERGGAASGHRVFPPDGLAECPDVSGVHIGTGRFAAVPEDRAKHGIPAARGVPRTAALIASPARIRGEILRIVVRDVFSGLRHRLQAEPCLPHLPPRWVLAATVLMTSSLPEPLRAQTPARSVAASSTPGAVARAFFDALEYERWTEAARLVHPTVLARHREQILASIRHGSAGPGLTAEDLLRRDPRMPLEAAEYEASRVAETSSNYERRQLQRAGVASVAELERLSPEEAFARFLQASDERRSIQRELELGAGVQLAEVLARATPRAVRTVIGTVTAPKHPGTPAASGGELAHVVYTLARRARHDRAPLAELTAVVGVRRHAGAWKLDPGDHQAHELLGGGSMSVMLEHPDGLRADLRDLVRTAAVWPREGSPRLRVRMSGAGSDPVQVPPTTLVFERLALDGTVAARIEVPAEAWSQLAGAMSLWSLLIPEEGESPAR